MAEDKEFYKYFFKYSQKKLERAEQLLDKVEKEIKTVEKILEENKDFINNNCNYNYNELMKLVYNSNNRKELIETVKLKEFIIKNNTGKMSNLLLRAYLLSLGNNISYKFKLKSLINTYKHELLDYNLFSIIYNMINLNIIKYILKGEVYSFGKGVGNLYIARREMDGKKRKYRIDWNKSKKYKEKLIAEGKTPYKAIYDEKGNKIGDNGGIEWIVRHVNEEDIWIMWSNNSSIGNNIRYSFKPSNYSPNPVKGEDGKYIRYTMEDVRRMIKENNYPKDEVYKLNIGFVQKLSLYKELNNNNIDNYLIK